MSMDSLDFDQDSAGRYIAIIDLDGVIADNTERFARATRGDGSIDWKIAFDPSLVSLDVVIDGAVEAVEHIDKRGYEVIFLTSRPEAMRSATEQWLARHDLAGYDLIMKPMSKQYTKTVAWKAEEVRRIASQPGVAWVHFIDDEEGNRTAVVALGMRIVCATSLADYRPDDKAIII